MSHQRTELRDTDGTSTILVCAPHENPRAILQVIRTRSILGLLLAIAIFELMLTVTLWLLPTLPAIPPSSG